MDFTISCPCGTQLKVTSADAGATKQCRCGRINSVPSLSKLRVNSGQKAYNVDVAEKIRYMRAAGELVTRGTCVYCGAMTDHVLECVVECERPYIKGRGYWSTAFFGVFGSIFSAFWLVKTLNQEYLDNEVHGRDLTVHIPLPLCPSCSAEARKDPSHLRNLTSSVPLYGELLEQYPQAHITIV